MALYHQVKYKPHGAQIPFHQSKAFINAFVGGYGCIRGDQRIITIDGPKRIAEIVSPTFVLSHDGRDVVWSLATPSFQKGTAPLFEVRHQYGSFVSTAAHRLAVLPYSYQRVGHLAQGACIVQLSSCSQSLHETSRDISRSELLADARRLLKTIGDSTARYSAYRRQCDPQPQEKLDSDRASVPSSGDASESSQASCSLEKLPS